MGTKVAKTNYLGDKEHHSLSELNKNVMGFEPSLCGGQGASSLLRDTAGLD